VIRWRYYKCTHTSPLGRPIPIFGVGLPFSGFGPKSLKRRALRAAYGLFPPLDNVHTGAYHGYMTTRPEPTVAMTARIFVAQNNALRDDYPQLSKSALIRVLLHLFLSKQLPTNVYPLALEEMTRAEQALKSNKTKQVSVA
jgi:hypothetical protein